MVDWHVLCWVESIRETDDADFSYKEVSQLSDVTDEVYPESVSGDPDLNDYNRLVQ